MSHKAGTITLTDGPREWTPIIYNLYVLSIHLSTYVRIFLPYLSIYLFIKLYLVSMCLSIYLIILFIYLSIIYDYLLIHSYIHRSINHTYMHISIDIIQIKIDILLIHDILISLSKWDSQQVTGKEVRSCRFYASKNVCMTIFIQGHKQMDCSKDLPFLCPSPASPYLATRLNSRHTNMTGLWQVFRRNELTSTHLFVYPTDRYKVFRRDELTSTHLFVYIQPTVIIAKGSYTLYLHIWCWKVGLWTFFAFNLSFFQGYSKYIFLYHLLVTFLFFFRHGARLWLLYGESEGETAQVFHVSQQTGISAVSC